MAPLAQENLSFDRACSCLVLPESQADLRRMYSGLKQDPCSMAVNNYSRENYTSLETGQKGIPAKTLAAQELPQLLAGLSLMRHSKMTDYHLLPRALEEDMHTRVGKQMEMDPEEVGNLGRMKILVVSLEMDQNPSEVVPLAGQNCSVAAESD